MPTDEPSRAGLTKTGIPERVGHGIAEPERDVGRDGNPLCAHHLLEDVLVHAERGCEHARADVGEPGQLEQALDGAVLAVRAVEQDEHDVERRERRG